mmetsp:Transcript_11011/g.41123  ORF Transcript_11011/g.41123 Transcript_11011/m.41123 type:complete len:258 (-) Transcript_11011:160-933(-)
MEHGDRIDEALPSRPEQEAVSAGFGVQDGVRVPVGLVAHAPPLDVGDARLEQVVVPVHVAQGQDSHVQLLSRALVAAAQIRSQRGPGLHHQHLAAELRQDHGGVERRQVAPHHDVVPGLRLQVRGHRGREEAVEVAAWLQHARRLRLDGKRPLGQQAQWLPPGVPPHRPSAHDAHHQQRVHLEEEKQRQKDVRRGDLRSPQRKHHDGDGREPRDGPAHQLQMPPRLILLPKGLQQPLAGRVQDDEAENAVFLVQFAV